MLLQFMIKNCSSFANESCLNMVASNTREHEYSLIEYEGVSILPIITIYGANASGKSNLLSSLVRMARFVCESLSLSEDMYSPLLPFIFDEKTIHEPAECEVTFLVNKIEYRYGFSIAKYGVKEEYLDFKKPTNNCYIKLFNRDESATTTAGTSKEITPEEKKAIKLTNSVGIRKQDLVLTFLGRRAGKGDEGLSRFSGIYNWFINICACSLINETPSNLTFREDSNLEALYTDPELKKKHLQFVQKADPCIFDLRIEESKNASGEKNFVVKSVHHERDKDKEVTVPTVLESAGTLNAIRIYPCIESVLSKGGLLIADELDSSLHPLLLLEIINMFTNPITNPKHAQLICTMHNVIAMDKKYLRRDEIWFIEKNLKGESELYPLTNVVIGKNKVRSDADYCKQYILGNYGAIPDFINEVDCDNG